MILHVRWATAAGASGLAVAVLVAACGGSSTTVKAAPGGATDQSAWPKNDGSLCDRFVHWSTNSQLEVSETAGSGSIRPNIRRVFKSVGEHDDSRTVLMCREIDTNLDGVKDVVRTFNEKGEPLHEEADTNYDGKVDDWVNFAGGRIEEEDVDTTFTTGRPNVWKFCCSTGSSRICRNLHLRQRQARTIGRSIATRSPRARRQRRDVRRPRRPLGSRRAAHGSRRGRAGEGGGGSRRGARRLVSGHRGRERRDRRRRRRAGGPEEEGQVAAG